MLIQSCDKTSIFYSYSILTAQLLDHKINKCKKLVKKTDFAELIFAMEPISILFLEINFTMWDQNHKREFCKNLFCKNLCCLSILLILGHLVISLIKNYLFGENQTLGKLREPTRNSLK